MIQICVFIFLVLVHVIGRLKRGNHFEIKNVCYKMLCDLT